MVQERQDHPEDRELARRAGEGDERAWRSLYEMTCQPLFNFLCYQVGDREAAKDLLQDTYLAAAGKLGSYRGEGSLLGWLRAIALRRSLDWRRRVKRRLRLHRRFAAEAHSASRDSGVGHDEAADARLDIAGDAFRAALARLSPRQRATLILRELEEQSFLEIALALGCSEATARVHYHRARAGMRHWLDSEDTADLADDMGGQQA